jgi:hypothetical protein
MILILSLIVLIVLLIIIIKLNSNRNTTQPTQTIEQIYTGTNDNSVTGIIQPYFCSGNPFSSGNTKISFNTFYQKYGMNLLNMPNTIKGIKVFGVGDQNGTGWLGGDSIASIELTNGDLLFTFGDSFICKIDSPNVWLSLGMRWFNRSLKNILKNVLKNRKERFRFFADSFQYKYQVKNRHG